MLLMTKILSMTGCLTVVPSSAMLHIIRYSSSSCYYVLMMMMMMMMRAVKTGAPSGRDGGCFLCMSEQASAILAALGWR
jgi:pyrroline-5-carboxylate reductase